MTFMHERVCYHVIRIRPRSILHLYFFCNLFVLLRFYFVIFRIFFLFDSDETFIWWLRKKCDFCGFNKSARIYKNVSTFNDCSIVLTGKNTPRIPKLQQNFIPAINILIKIQFYMQRARRGRDRMVVGFTTTCEISAYHH